MVRFARLAAITAALVAALPAIAQAAFPGSNGTIAYTGFPGPGDSEIFSLLPPVGAPVQLTNDTAGQGEPSYSPSGDRIAFAQSGPGITAEIWTIRADGGDPRQITNGHVDAHPAYSPNGRWIVFGRDGGIAKVRTDGSGARRLTKVNGNKLYDYQPTWSPNGRLIAFASNRGNPKSAAADVWTMRPDGSRKRNLTRSKSYFDVAPDFSPTGGSIVYASERGAHRRIWRMRSNGRRRQRVPISGTYSEQSDPAFSPNGKRIAFSSAGQFGSPNGLFTAPAGGGAATPLIAGADLAGEVTWQPR